MEQICFITILLSFSFKCVNRDLHFSISMSPLVPHSCFMHCFCLLECSSICWVNEEMTLVLFWGLSSHFCLHGFCFTFLKYCATRPIRITKQSMRTTLSCFKVCFFFYLNRLSAGVTDDCVAQKKDEDPMFRWRYHIRENTKIVMNNTVYITLIEYFVFPFCS